MLYSLSRGSLFSSAIPDTATRAYSNHLHKGRLWSAYASLLGGHLIFFLPQHTFGSHLWVGLGLTRGRDHTALIFYCLSQRAAVCINQKFYQGATNWQWLIWGPTPFPVVFLRSYLVWPAVKIGNPRVPRQSVALILMVRNQHVRIRRRSTRWIWVHWTSVPAFLPISENKNIAFELRLFGINTSLFSAQDQWPHF